MQRVGPPPLPSSLFFKFFFAGLGGRGETERFQLSILPHEAGSARLAAAPVSFLFFFFDLAPTGQRCDCALLLQRCPTCVSGTSNQSRPERERGGGGKKDVSARFPLSLFVSSGWAVFFGRGDRRKQKAGGEGEQLAAANPPFRTQTGDNGGHRSICFYLSFFVLFLPHRAAGRCFTFSTVRSLGPLSSHLFRHLPGQQFLLCMSQTRREGEAESQREKKEEGEFFLAPFILFPPPSPPFHSSSPPYTSQSPPSVQPTLPPPPPSTHPPLPNFPPLLHLCFHLFALETF